MQDAKRDDGGTAEAGVANGAAVRALLTDLRPDLEFLADVTAARERLREIRERSWLPDDVPLAEQLVREDRDAR